ncbi:DUF6055 domain-containing protein [Siphonobacter sp. SORGH_AS_0500]|uniref:DUF6055 domain-containing protein n=1 Tax=Siphonobacter sp. SORGH_AS_0500 TaxID=1864824 RepID=UPI00286CD41B|nr:DUF6055 domain-containing protein [Siphonobacter sp. SORGH_AS_0500]
MKSWLMGLTALTLLWGCKDNALESNQHAADHAARVTAGKQVYIPNDLKNINLNDDNSEWSYQRSAQSDNVVIFWQKGFGNNPLQASDPNMRFDVNAVLNTAENIYTYDRQTLQFTKANTRMDTLKLMIMVFYNGGWQATGAGYDNVIGAIWMSPSAVRSSPVLAHEIGHAFQYQVHCDGGYGFRDQNYVGTFWEQCAQYMSRQLYPGDALGDLGHFVSNSYQNFSHENIRYQSFHLPEYWKAKHGADFLGRVWKEAIGTEHPLQTYKRITGLSQDQLNDEIGEYAMRCMNWDFPNGSYVRDRAAQGTIQFSTALSQNSDGSYQVASNIAPQCYGFNAIPLNVPTTTLEVKVNFEGLNSTQFSNIQGWRYGLVAVNQNGGVTYSTLGKTQQGTVTLTISLNTKELYLVVAGAPQQHFNHPWGLAESDTPKFPYKVSFINTQPK